MPFAKPWIFICCIPKKTLIVVTADHECGGQTIGFAGTAYDTFFEILAKQQYSYEVFDEYFLAPYKTEHNPAPADIDAAMWTLIYNVFGLDGAGIYGGCGRRPVGLPEGEAGSRL